ncbi:MAG TPA: CHASE2 domain-containing protein, partial [Rhodocyclaceae bacterium]|nr:CHASE2 domain-containing protein [Rhodocyclaceae bacterium]
MKKFLVRYVLGGLLVLVFLAHAAGSLNLHFVNIVDAYLYDARLRLTMPGKVDDRIVIVDIDERSLAEEGRWPWNRDKVAQMVRQLTDHYKVAIVGFDVVFAEPDSTSGLPVLERLADRQLKGNREFLGMLDSLRGELDYDQQFANTLKGRPVVLGYYFNNDAASRYGKLPAPVLTRGDLVGLGYSVFLPYQGYGANLPQFASAAAASAHFNPMLDFDGVVRRVPLLVEFDGAFYEALSLSMVRLLREGGAVLPGYPEGKPANGIEWIEVAGKQASLKVPVDEHVAALVPYLGHEKSFAYVSAADVLRGKVPADALQGKIILVGTTAPGLKDLRVTPVGESYPGVEIHANMIAGMLDGTIKKKPAYVLGIDAVLLLALGGMLVLLLP